MMTIKPLRLIISRTRIQTIHSDALGPLDETAPNLYMGKTRSIRSLNLTPTDHLRKSTTRENVSENIRHAAGVQFSFFMTTLHHTFAVLMSITWEPPPYLMECIPSCSPGRNRGSCDRDSQIRLFTARYPTSQRIAFISE